jgi:phasin family protein
MITTPAQFAELNKGNMDALFALSHTMFDATEKLVDLNLAAAKATMEESAEKATALMGAKDVQELLAMTSGFAQPTVEKFVSYSRTAYGIASGAGRSVAHRRDPDRRRQQARCRPGRVRGEERAGRQRARRLRVQERGRRGQHRVRHVQQGCQAGRRCRRVERCRRHVGHAEGRLGRQRRRQGQGQESRLIGD